ncbi:MAG: D-serine ammonia-lyase [Thermotaleaceae bacterium]
MKVKNKEIFEDISNQVPLFWTNPSYDSSFDMEKLELKFQDIVEAEQRWKRFAPFFSRVFEETRETKGMIESAVFPLRKAHVELEKYEKIDMPGSLYLKGDHSLPISGSIKARGGIYEVLCFAEKIALQSGMLKLQDDYSLLAEKEFKDLFSQYSIAVGSTGNLGLSIGIMSRVLGFQATVHMSSDAKPWKKQLLRDKGAIVKEYAFDFSHAIEAGRKEAERDPNCHFVDDENSRDLFLGYAVSALRLKKQFEEMNILVDEEHPLLVYLPCGVGGGPGGVSFGLKWVFGKDVHPIFVEPVQSVAMMLGMITGLHNNIAVQDIGLSNETIADGLAVGRPSGFVGKLIEPIVAGFASFQDKELYNLLKILYDTEGIALEPSALAGFKGISMLLTTDEGKKLIRQLGGAAKLSKATHLVWATGGQMVPETIMREDYKKAAYVLGE